ncbi:MAG: hypothetical protein M3548_14280 [Actinomycetota bacterium]|nr:hypothetical protein [Actinomycetota bacterium]
MPLLGVLLGPSAVAYFAGLWWALVTACACALVIVVTVVRGLRKAVPTIANHIVQLDREMNSY